MLCCEKSSRKSQKSNVCSGLYNILVLAYNNNNNLFAVNQSTKPTRKTVTFVALSNSLKPASQSIVNWGPLRTVFYDSFTSLQNRTCIIQTFV